MTRKFRAPQKLFSAARKPEFPPPRHPPNKKAGGKPAFSQLASSWRSVFGGDRAAPAEPVVHADLDGVLVVAERAAGDVGRAASREGRAVEVIVLVFSLGRPVRGEHVFEAGTDGVAVLAVTRRSE